MLVVSDLYVEEKSDRESANIMDPQKVYGAASGIYSVAEDIVSELHTVTDISDKIARIDIIHHADNVSEQIKQLHGLVDKYLGKYIKNG